MPRRGPDHEALIERGLALHEARRYAAALPYFDRALAAAPGCAVAIYNRANTLHMLGREAEAYLLLQDLIAVGPEELRQRCPCVGPRSLQLDTYFLLFWVVLYHRGFCPEAFAYAEEHLRRRRRGLASKWTVREVRAEVAAMRKQYREAMVEPTALSRSGIARPRER